MSRSVATLVYSRKVGSLTRKAVLAYCADRASDDGRGVWASKQSIADEIECDRGTVIRTMNALVKEGILVPVGSRSCQGGATVEYNINIAAVEELPLVRQPKTSRRGPLVAVCHQWRPATPGSGTAPPKPSLEPTPPVVSDETTPPAVELKEEHVLEAWNVTAGRLGLPKAKMTPERRKKLKTFIRRHPIDDITEGIGAIERSPFLCGENDRGWKAHFNWMLEPRNFTKLIEGNYDR